MQIRALRTFNSKYGLIRTGIVTTVDDRYGNQLIRSGLAAMVKPDEQREPDANAALPGAPQTKKVDLGNAEGEGEDENLPEDDPAQADGTDSSEGQEDDGQDSESSSRPRGRRSRAKTSKRRGVSRD